MDVNEAYQGYCANPTQFNLRSLDAALYSYALRIGCNLFRIYDKSVYDHACQNAATTVLLQFRRQFDPQRAGFSTWAHQSIRGDLIDWWRKRERRHEVSLSEFQAFSTDPNFHGIGLVNTEEIDAQLEEVLAAFTEEERKLCEMKNDGASLREMADAMGVSLATVKRRWKATVEKGRGILVP